MPYTCKGICERDKETNQSNRFIYARGNVFCKHCDMKRPKPPEGKNRCDCCGAKVRLKPTSSAMCYMRRLAYNKRKNHKDENHIPRRPYEYIKEAEIASNWSDGLIKSAAEVKRI